MADDKDKTNWDWDSTSPINAGEVKENAPAPKEIDITPRDLLEFAKVCLAWCMLIFIVSGILYGCNKDFKDFFEKSSLIIPPIVTLILGFYFGKKSS